LESYRTTRPWKDRRILVKSREKFKGKLEQLPPELIQVVLSELPDIASLESAVLTGPHLYYAFMDAEAQITKKVFLQQIPAELLHDTLAAEVSSREETWRREKADDFLSQYFARDQQPFRSSLQWKLSQVLSLARLYNIINFFTTDLVSPILTQNPLSGDKEVTSSWQPLSQSERNRIQCNFYRFQIYCNLFRDKKNGPFHSDDDQRDNYFAHFAPWENEQLACINDYLLRIITPGLRLSPKLCIMTHSNFE
jgi:hypothetical protein